MMKEDFGGSKLRSLLFRTPRQRLDVIKKEPGKYAGCVKGRVYLLGCFVDVCWVNPDGSVIVVPGTAPPINPGVVVPRWSFIEFATSCRRYQGYDLIGTVMMKAGGG